MIEEQANIIYRRIAPSKDHKEPKGKEKLQRQRSGSGGPEGEKKILKKAKMAKVGQFLPKKPARSNTNVATQPIVCYRCGEPGHKAYGCEKPRIPGADPREVKPGKGRGQKD